MTIYPTNVSDSQWLIISKFLDVKSCRRYELREIVNAILYLMKTGCQWRMLPADFAGWKIVCYYFSVWKQSGLIEMLHESLVEKRRVRYGRNEEPGVGIIDAQSVKNTLVSNEDKGFDAGKRIKGTKRHIIADTLALTLAAVIQTASVQDRNGGIDVIQKLIERWKRVIKIFTDSGYSGTLMEKVKHRFKISVEVIKRKEQHQFKVLPKSWIVDRTFAWLVTNRRA